MLGYLKTIRRATIRLCECTLVTEKSCSYSNHIRRFEQLFSHIDIPPSQVNILDGTKADLIAECEEYEEKIKNAGGIELFLAGIGEDGHVAFNEPGKTLIDKQNWLCLMSNRLFFVVSHPHQDPCI